MLLSIGRASPTWPAEFIFAEEARHVITAFIFLILVRHIGQNDTLSAFSSTQPLSYLLIASSQVTISPCQVLRHLKQISVAHSGHTSLVAWSFGALIRDPQPGLVQYLTSGLPSSALVALNRSYFSVRSSGKTSRKVTTWTGRRQAKSRHLISSTCPFSIRPLKAYKRHSRQNLCSHGSM